MRNEYEITPSFFNLFIKNNTENCKQLTDDERTALPMFIKYIGGLGKATENLFYIKLINYWQNQYENLEGQGVVSYVFLSSDPNILVNRLEVLIGEYFAGNKNCIS